MYIYIYINLYDVCLNVPFPHLTLQLIKLRHKSLFESP